MAQGVRGKIQTGAPDQAALVADGMRAPTVLRRPWLYYALMAAAVLGALALRLPHLDQRPMHTDEAVHAYKLGELLDQGSYVYDPHEYHGPIHYYFTLPLLWLRGIHAYEQIPGETLLRLVPALFGVGLVLLLMLVADGLGRAAALGAATLTALSPAMVFYSRYYIQEIPLVFFTFAALAACWRYTRRQGVFWALAAGLSVGLMHATKETCVISWASLAGAAGLAAFWGAKVDGVRPRPRGYVHRWHLAGALALALAVSILCLTACFSNPRAALDSIRTYLVYLERGGSGDSSTNGVGIHNHPWHYYLHLLLYYRNSAGPFWSEASIVALAVVGAIRALLPLGARTSPSAPTAGDPLSGANIHLLRFLAFYTILMTAIYCAIPYKTPWCMLGFLHGMILLAGVGVAALWRWSRHRSARAVVLVALALGCGHLGAQAWRGNSNRFDADPRNPYVYGHTSYNILRLARRADALAASSGLGREMLIKVMVPKDDHWPLPWLLRRFRQVGYWRRIHEAPGRPGTWIGLPEELDAPLIVAGPELAPLIEARAKQKYIVEYYGLRPGVLLAAMIRADVWDQFMATQQAGPAEAKTK